MALGLEPTALSTCFGTPRHSLSRSDFRRRVDGSLSGVIRISLGFESTFDDAWTFVDYRRTFLR